MAELAILGGTPVRTALFPAYNPIGAEEKQAVAEVMDSGLLSSYIGAWHEDFYGGPLVRELEAKWRRAFGVRHAVAVNSATSGLYAAMGACGVAPGDEVIVSPYTMSASATAPLIYGATPIFADIDPRDLCISPESIRARLSPRTKAIIVVHIFGHPARMEEIMAIAREHGLLVVEDCAQAPMSRCDGRYVGAIGDIGVFSLNYHKHIHTGEGGVAVTDNPDLAERLELLRNHGEVVVDDKGTRDIFNIIGYNYRLTELQAAIGVHQIDKLEGLLEKRRANAAFFDRELSGLPGIEPQPVRQGCTHAYYNQVFFFDQERVGIPRNVFIKAVGAELPSAYLRERVPLIGYGYVKPLYLQRIYHEHATDCGPNCPRYLGVAEYGPGLCPITENMHYHVLFNHEFHRPGMSDGDLRDVADAYFKVYEQRHTLRGLALEQGK
ncbi:MAG: DegT/DnrJ/EryC1/StrS family aminotransferase [Desulfovibrionaceae bacterium]|nr:DegT/DnrJ/EryC1/StrS family aminotransferase [Desulfovibrionaceae bacterium]